MPNCERWIGSAASAPASRTSWTCPCADRVQALEVPHRGAGADGHPAPAQDVLHGDVGERSRCSLQRRSRGGVSVGDQQREAVEQQVEGTRSHPAAAGAPARRGRSPAGRPARRDPRPCPPRPRRSGRSRARGPGRTARAASRPSAAAGEHRCQDHEAKATWPRSRSTRARWNSSSGPASAVATSPSAASNAPAWKLACAAASARSARRARVLRQRDGALQERRRGGEPAARLRPAGRALELQGDLLVGPGGGRGQMPRTTVRVGLPIGRLRQRQVDRAAILHRRRPIHRRAHQRMPERHPLADRQQPVRLRGLRGRRPDPEPLGRAPQQQRIADRLRRRDQQQTPRIVSQRLESPDEALLDPSCQRRARPAARTRPPTASPSTPAAAPATPADSRASRR